MAYTYTRGLRQLHASPTVAWHRGQCSSCAMLDQSPVVSGYTSGASYCMIEPKNWQPHSHSAAQSWWDSCCGPSWIMSSLVMIYDLLEILLSTSLKLFHQPQPVGCSQWWKASLTSVLWGMSNWVPVCHYLTKAIGVSPVLHVTFDLFKLLKFFMNL